MSPENQKILLNKFPKLYRQHSLPITQTCMCWGFECGDGWFTLIHDLSEKLENIGNIEATEVKEKYGTLRFYCSGGNQETDKLIREAEELSAKTCEICGAPGELRGKHWLSTLCDSCLENK